jgi:hypothetical protein
MKKFYFAIFVAFLFFASNAQAEIIWSDGFESGNFNAWTSNSGSWATSGGSNHSGTKRAQINGEGVLLLSESTSGYSDITLDYWYRIYAGLEDSDYVYVDWTANGSDWQNLKTYTNIASSESWQQEIFSLPAEAENNPLFGFRLRSSALSSSSDCIYFDDFSLSGTPVPEPPPLIIILGILPLLFLKRK